MSKYQALIDALEAGPTEGASAFDDEDNTIIDPNVPDVAVLSVERMDIDGDGHYWFGQVSQANAAFYAAANPATIRALLADLERAEKALKAVAEWGPFPRVPDSYSDEPGATVSYAVAFGSNGERDYIRGIAQVALAQMAGG